MKRLRDFAEGLVFGLPVVTDERVGPHEILVGDRGQIDRHLAARSVDHPIAGMRRPMREVSAALQRLGIVANGVRVHINSGYRTVYEQGAIERGMLTRTGQIARAWGELGTAAEDAFDFPEFNRPAFAALRCEVASTRKALIV